MSMCTLFAVEIPSGLAADVLVPAAVGAGVGLAIVLTYHFLRSPRPARVNSAEPGPEIDPFLQGSASEQRAVHRRGGALVEVSVRPGAEGEAAVCGWVLDRSAAGLALRVERPFAIGARLLVRATSASPLLPSVEVQVKSAAATADGWRLGCQFVKAPTWALLMSFG